MDYLFAYGTLRQGHAPDVIAGAVARLKRIGKGVVAGRLYDLGSFPGAILDGAADGMISGEIYQASDALWTSLDAYEGFDPSNPSESLFVRTRCHAKLDDGRSLECWIYVFNRNPGIQLRS